MVALVWVNVDAVYRKEAPIIFAPKHITGYFVGGWRPRGY